VNYDQMSLAAGKCPSGDRANSRYSRVEETTVLMMNLIDTQAHLLSLDHLYLISASVISSPIGYATIATVLGPRFSATDIYKSVITNSLQLKASFTCSI